MGTLSRARRRLQSTAARFGRYTLALALRSVLLNFFKEFRVGANFYITSQITRKYSLESCNLLEPNMLMVLRIHFDYLQSTSKLIRHYYMPQPKQHVLKFCRQEESSFEWNILTITKHILLLLRNMVKAKFEIVFLSIFLNFSIVKFIIILSIYLNFPVAQSKKFRSACWLTFSIVFFFDSLSN